MAVTTRETRVLSGIPVVGDGLVRRTSIGFQPVNMRTSAFLSHERCPSPRSHEAVYEPRMRHFQADTLDLDQAACRAGRPQWAMGTLASRSPAQRAGWSVRGKCSLAGASLARMLALGATRLPGVKQTAKRKEAGLAWFRSDRGTLSTSTRGRRAAAV